MSFIYLRAGHREIHLHDKHNRGAQEYSPGMGYFPWAVTERALA
jgi:hypothetical protein